jgi:Helicase associated domain
VSSATVVLPEKYKSSDGYRLGGWVAEQRHKRDAISPERKARLDSLDFDWDPFKTDWEEGFEHLTAYVKEYQHCRVPHAYRSPDGYRLGGWVLKQRQSRDKLSAEQRLRLDGLGFDWDPVATRWKQGFERLRDYVRQHGHCRVPLRYKSPDGFPLGKWVGDRRELQDTTSPKEREELTSLGFIWNVHEDSWEEGFEHLTAYVKEHKHCRVPVQYRSSDGYRLGRWVHVQRRWQDRLSVERRSRLDALGFVWDPAATQWETGFEHLQEYVRMHKHCRVPHKYKSSDGFALGIWVNNLRKRRSFLSDERIGRLDALGFIWNTRQAGIEKVTAIDTPGSAAADTSTIKRPDVSSDAAALLSDIARLGAPKRLAAGLLVFGTLTRTPSKECGLCLLTKLGLAQFTARFF